MRMARRGTPQRMLYERCFPIRVRFVVSATGVGYPGAARMNAWLHGNLAQGDFAKPSDSVSSFREALVVYFRRLADTERFVDAVPGAQLADGTALSGSRAPPCLRSAVVIDCAKCATSTE